jgi:hypothetical protein
LRQNSSGELKISGSKEMNDENDVVLHEGEEIEADINIDDSYVM